VDVARSGAARRRDSRLACLASIVLPARPAGRLRLHLAAEEWALGLRGREGAAPPSFLPACLPACLPARLPAPSLWTRLAPS